MSMVKQAVRVDCCSFLRVEQELESSLIRVHFQFFFILSFILDIFHSRLV